MSPSYSPSLFGSNGRAQRIKACASERRLGVRVGPGGFTPPGGRGGALSRFEWVAGAVG